MQAVFIEAFPQEAGKKIKVLLPSAPGFVSMQEILKTDNSILSFFCKIKNSSIVELQDYLNDILPEIHLEIKEAKKIYG